MSDQLNGIAVIGMAGRFPKAMNIDEFWQNLVEARECISFYTDEELVAAGVDPKNLSNPDYVKAKGEVAEVDMFDASFFGINPREAEVTDPQHRMLLECAWEALEHAGVDSSKYDGSIGVYAGKSMDYYLLLNVYPQIKKEISAGSLQAAIGNDKDSLTTLISYRLNLTGPGISVQTSSSTSLVAVSIACLSLMSYQCDIALAGGITAGPPIKSGYLYQAGGIWDPEGHCRAFDAKAKGFVPGTGMGLVVLKRLEDAIADRDHIWAVIKGSAVNNDGSKKVSYSAPSVDAQAEVVAQAQAFAGVHPETIQYIETHGTGTNMGDPIEIAALTQAFRSQTSKKQFCAVGSVKTNIGHLDNAAGVVGLIKVILSLKYKKIPPSLHFETPNPKIDFENSPFFVNTQPRDWTAPADGTPRRAGVTSLGMGGTNAHVIVEEFREEDYISNKSTLPIIKKSAELLVLSAKTPSALDKITSNLAAYLKKNPSLDLNHVAYTLQIGRRDLDYRRAVVCHNIEDAVDALEKRTPGLVFDSVNTAVNRPVVFLFPGQGSQYPNMAKELYEKEPTFKQAVDTCSGFLKPILGLDLRSVIYPPNVGNIADCEEKLQETRLTQPALFTIEYAMACLWMEWGVKPAGMIGHSIGEYTAACISGCISLEDALTLVALRGRLMHGMDRGAMLSVGMTEPEISSFLKDQTDLSLAAVNSPKNCVVSGRFQALEELEKELTQRQVFCRRIHTSHAFHSPMMDPILDEFHRSVSRVKWNKPSIPFISCVTGTWIPHEEVQNPVYWVKQLRQAVRFSEGIREILRDSSRVLLEAGPGNSLSVLVKQQDIQAQTGTSPEIPFPSIRHAKQGEKDMVFLMKTLAQLWMKGVSIDWKGFHSQQAPRRVPLPTYPFERKRYWIEIKQESSSIADKSTEPAETVGTDAGLSPAENKEAAKPSPEVISSRTFQPRPVMPNEYTAPTNATEEGIVEIWEDILGIKPIGINDNFFDLGGHSLLATLFLSKIQEKFNVRLEMRIIFETPTIATIAGMIDEQKKNAGPGDLENLLSEIENLSPGEVENALSREDD